MYYSFQGHFDVDMTFCKIIHLIIREILRESHFLPALLKALVRWAEVGWGGGSRGLRGQECVCLLGGVLKEERV